MKSSCCNRMVTRKIFFSARHSVFDVACAVLFLATLLGNWSDIHEFVSRSIRGLSEWNGRNYRANGKDTDAFRELVERHLYPNEGLYYCLSSSDGCLSPAERSTHLALSWAHSPSPVKFGSKDGVDDASAVVVSSFLKADFPGYWLVTENEYAALWRRGDVIVESSDTSRAAWVPGLWHEIVGVFVVCAMVGWFVWRMRRVTAHCRGSVSPTCTDPPIGHVAIPAVGAIAFFCFAAFLTLNHTFVAPNGLGVYGGKAKLFLLCGGIPEGFFNNPDYSTYQPAYPPGLTLLTLGAYLISGGCGEWLVQLIPVFGVAVSLWLMMRFATGSRWASLWILASFASKQTLQMATLFYAEPFVALLSILGWMRLRECRDALSGWILLGASGLFKVEGLVLLLAVWVAFGIDSILRGGVLRSGFVCRKFLAWITRLVFASFAPLLWIVGCHFAGARFYDYAPFWNPDFAKFCDALCYLAKMAFEEPWRYGFAYPLATAIVALTFVRKHIAAEWRAISTLSISASVALISLVLFASIYSLSRAPDFGWHLWSSAARVLWIPSLFVLIECAAETARHRVYIGCIR